MDDDRTLIDLLAVAGAGQLPLEIRHYGHFMKRLKDFGLIGGVLRKISTDHLGRIKIESLVVSSILGCGHLVSSIGQIAGICQIPGCNRFCCNLHPECLRVCELTGLSVCRKHYEIRNGIVVSTHARKGLWRLKARRVAHRKGLIANGKRQISQSTR